MIELIGSLLAGFFKGLFPSWFAPKTAAEQRAGDAEVALKDAKQANQIEQEVRNEDDDVVDADLARRVRPERL